jgi:hypothetical protein
MKTNAHILTRVKEAFFRLDLPLFIEVAVLMMLGNIVGRVRDCGAVVAVTVLEVDLLLPMQSVPITTDALSSNLDHGGVCNKGCQSLATGR